MMTNLQKEIQFVFKKFPHYWDGEVLLKNKAIDDIRAYEPNLLAALLKNDAIKDIYSVKIGDNYIFKNEEFISMLRYKNYLENSYTKYSNEIGLTTEGKFLRYSSDVVLDFPHKDSILEGGMTKEDNGRNEIYLHNILAKDEIDTLLEPKVLTNMKKFVDDNQSKTTNFNSSDNLIIKGNNLIALHTLQKKYASKIKLIYIDPPYNTGNDSFKYNDNFNHSTWLTFMKNRLEIAKELLSEDGYIVIQTDDSEQAYLKVLMDTIFSRDNYVNTVSLLFKNIAGASGGGQDKRLKKNIEFLTIYAKNYKSATPFNDVYEYTKISDLVQTMRDDNVSWKYTSILEDPGEKIYVGSAHDGSGDKIKIYKRKNPKMTTINQVMKKEGISEAEAYAKYAHQIFTTAMPQSSIRPRVMKKYEEICEEPNDLTSIEYVPKSGRNKGKVYEQFYRGANFRLFAWLSDVSVMIDDIPYKSDQLGTFWNYISEMNNVNKEGKTSFSNGKKPEKLLKDLITLTTNEEDIVLDFFMGSATTQAVAMKMNRQFIGIEQMDYINTVSVPRLKKVAKGEQSGISKDVSWEGGGSFVYAELYELNQVYVNDIQSSTNQKEIEKIVGEIRESNFLNLKVDLEKALVENNQFYNLELDEQKAILIQLLDNNQLYLNYSEIDDDQYAIDEDTKAFNASFYDEEV